MQRNVIGTGLKSVRIFSAIKYGMFSLHTFFFFFACTGCLAYSSDTLDI